MTDPIGSEEEGTEIYEGAFGGAHLCVNDPCDDARHWPEAAVRLFNHLRADLEAARAENKRVEAVIERCDREMDAGNLTWNGTSITEWWRATSITELEAARAERDSLRDAAAEYMAILTRQQKDLLGEEYEAVLSEMEQSTGASRELAQARARLVAALDAVEKSGEKV